MSSKTTPDTSCLGSPTADETRGEVLLTIDGTPRIVRFGLKFLKAFTTQSGADSPSEGLASLDTAPIAALLDMVALAVRLSVKESPAFTSDDALEIIDELSPDEQQHIFAVLINSIKANPIAAALTALTAAK